MNYPNISYNKSSFFVIILFFCTVSVTWSNESEINHYKSRAMEEPNNATAQYNLGVAYHKARKIEMSVKAFEKAIELDPNYKGALVALGQIYEGEGLERYKDKFTLGKARIYYEKALSIDPQDRYLHQLLAHVYLNQGRNREGIYQLILTGWYSVFGLLVEILIVMACILVFFLRKNRLLQVKVFGSILVMSVLSLAIPPLRPVTWSTGIPIGFAVVISLAVLIQEKNR